MDQLDFKIFRSLGFRPYGPTAGDLTRLNPWVIGKKVGADGNTVKLRLKKMKRSGFIKYFQVYPNYQLLGIHGAAYLFEVDDIARKNETLQRCALVDGVTEITNFIGPHLCIDFTYRDGPDEGRRLKLFCELSGSQKPEKFYERVMPPVDIRLSSTDWRIIKSLRYNAFKPLSKVAAELGLSTKTVRRRFERLAQAHALIVVPVIHPGEVPATITHSLLLYFYDAQRERALQQVIQTFEDTYFLLDASPRGNALLALAARTLAETEENLLKAKRIEGVRDAKLLILKQMREFSEWMDSVIDSKVAETAKRPGSVEVVTARR